MTATLGCCVPFHRRNMKLDGRAVSAEDLASLDKWTLPKDGLLDLDYIQLLFPHYPPVRSPARKRSLAGLGFHGAERLRCRVRG